MLYGKVRNVVRGKKLRFPPTYVPYRGGEGKGRHADGATFISSG